MLPRERDSFPREARRLWARAFVFVEISTLTTGERSGERRGDGSGSGEGQSQEHVLRQAEDSCGNRGSHEVCLAANSGMGERR